MVYTSIYIYLYTINSTHYEFEHLSALSILSIMTWGNNVVYSFENANFLNEYYIILFISAWIPTNFYLILQINILSQKINKTFIK